MRKIIEESLRTALMDACEDMVKCGLAQLCAVTCPWGGLFAALCAVQMWIWN